jgi:cyclopropane-fatty-acyl-phospholipid synthase
MKTNKIFFKKYKILPVDRFFKMFFMIKNLDIIIHKFPLGKKGDFVTSPKISDLFSEIIAIWIIACWESFGKPKNFNIIELGPGDGSLTKILLRSFKQFPEFNSIKKIYLFEESNYLKKIQKRKIINKDVKWINNFNLIKKGPVIFFGNEFFRCEYQ